MQKSFETPTVTLKEALSYGSKTLPSQEIRWLLEKITGLKYGQLLTHRDPVLTLRAYEDFCGCIDRLSRGEPFAYVIGDSPFRGRTFKVTPDVLIPRPESELLVHLAKTHLGENKHPKILDLGTGSGILAITLALELPNAGISATDIDLATLSVAKENAQLHGVHINWRQSDWFEKIEEFYDVIISNPPYIALNDPHLEALAFEPPLALCSGSDGFGALKKIIPEATHHLLSQGWLFCEHGYEQGSQCRALFREAGYENVESWFDEFGQTRVTGGQWNNNG